MQFGLAEEQQELMTAVRRLVERRAGDQDLRRVLAGDPGYDDVLWRAMTEQIGVAALAVPEEYGGGGFTSLETHLVLEVLGATLTPSPLLGSGVLATQALLLAATPADCERLLPGLAAGEQVGALAWADSAGRWRVDGSDIRATASATASGHSWRLSGSARLVLDGTAADVLLAVATTPTGVGLFEVAPDATGVTRTSTQALDPTLRFAAVEFDNVSAAALALDAREPLAQLSSVAAVAVTALQVGGAQRALDDTVAHLKERTQFERPLGSFQALKHRVADVLVSVETARSISWATAWAAAHSDADLENEAARAKAWCSEAFEHAAGEMIQLHGGIGITWEHDAQLYFKRAHATSHLFGSPRQHLCTLAAV